MLDILFTCIYLIVLLFMFFLWIKKKWIFLIDLSYKLNKVIVYWKITKIPILPIFSYFFRLIRFQTILNIDYLRFKWQILIHFYSLQFLYSKTCILSSVGASQKVWRMASKKELFIIRGWFFMEIIRTSHEVFHFKKHTIRFNNNAMSYLTVTEAQNDCQAKS